MDRVFSSRRRLYIGQVSRGQVSWGQVSSCVVVALALAGCPSPDAGAPSSSGQASPVDKAAATAGSSEAAAGANSKSPAIAAQTATNVPTAADPLPGVEAKTPAAVDSTTLANPNPEPAGDPKSAGPRMVGEARLGTFETSTGEIYFALSLMPEEAVLDPRPRRVVVLFDTSASQTGVYREDGLLAMEALLSGLADHDRVKVWALDVEVVPLTPDFVSPTDSVLESAIQQLKRRLPLGATDLRLGLETAMAEFAGDHEHAHRVAYLGDGVSRGDMLEMAEFGELVERLRSQHVSVASFAIGPQLDVETLAALANHTGGMVHVDAPNLSAQQSGLALARTVDASVFWPDSIRVSKSVSEIFPAKTPPLCSDRDTILIGQLADRRTCEFEISGTVGGLPIRFAWNLTPEAASDEFGFLPQLLRQARPSQGMSLATVGSPGLREVARVITATAEDLIAVGEKALNAGDLKGALSVAETVLRRDPKNPQALSIKRAVERQSKSK